MRSIIYLLRCPVSGTVRYVGRTNNIPRRLAKHVHESISESYKDRWIRSLLAAGLRPEVSCLSTVPQNGNWQDFERFFIAAARHFGFDLTNTTAGGEGSINMTDEGRARQSVSSRRVWADAEARVRQSIALKRAYSNPDALARKIEAMKLATSTPEARAIKSAASKLWHSNRSAKESWSETIKRGWEDPAARARASLASKKAWQDPAKKAKHAESMKASWVQRRLRAQTG